MRMTSTGRPDYDYSTEVKLIPKYAIKWDEVESGSKNNDAKLTNTSVGSRPNSGSGSKNKGGGKNKGSEYTPKEKDLIKRDHDPYHDIERKEAKAQDELTDAQRRADQYRLNKHIKALKAMEFALNDANMKPEEIERAIERLKSQMIEAARNMDFLEAAQFRDEIMQLQSRLRTEGKD